MTDASRLVKVPQKKTEKPSQNKTTKPHIVSSNKRHEHQKLREK